MSDAVKLALIAALWLTASSIDYHAAQTTALIARDLERAVYFSPLDAPRCPKLNGAFERLRIESALQADGGEWTYICIYGEAHHEAHHEALMPGTYTGGESS